MVAPTRGRGSVQQAGTTSRRATNPKGRGRGRQSLTNADGSSGASGGNSSGAVGNQSGSNANSQGVGGNLQGAGGTQSEGNVTGGTQTEGSAIPTDISTMLTQLAGIKGDNKFSGVFPLCLTINQRLMGLYWHTNHRYIGLVIGKAIYTILLISQ